jgi:hypothetical protein
MPPEANQNARGGGELGYPDELVPGPGDPEARGGLPHLRVAQYLADRREEAAAASSSETVTNTRTS